MLKSVTLSLSAALLLSASAMPASAFEREGGNSGGNHHNHGDDVNGSDQRVPVPTGKEGGAGVPGPVEGVGLPFLLAGGALAVTLAMRKRAGRESASGDRAS
jgi:hypothetical protein